MAKRPAPTRSAATPAPPRRHPPRLAAPPLPWKAHVIPLLSLIALATALYLPAVDGPFVYDDPNAISQSTLIRGLTPLSKFAVFSTRPLSDFSYAIDYAIGGLQTRGFHLTNIALHALNVALLYLIAVRTLALPSLAGRYGSARRGIAWAAAALFAAHPLASETVAYLSSRSEVLASTFYLTAVLAYIVAATERSRLAMAIIVLATGASGLSKEIAATIPLALLWYDWMFLADTDWHHIGRRWRLIGLAALPVALGGALFLGKAVLSPTGLGSYAATAGLGFDRFTRWQYLMTQFGVIVYYLRLVVLPYGQTFDYDWPLATTPFALGVLLPMVLLGGLVYAAWRLRRDQPLFTFAVGWMLVVLAPTSSLMPIADLAVERRMYLPLAGLMLFAAAGLRDLAAQINVSAWAQQVTYTVAVGLLLASGSVLTLLRAELWAHPIELHEDGVAKAPGNPRVRLNLGVTYLNSGQIEKAGDTLQVAKTLYDRGESVQCFDRIGAFIHYNLGAVRFTQKQYDDAEPELRRSLELGGQYLALRPMAEMLLSRIASVRGDWKQAAALMGEAIKYQDSADWRVDLANMQWKAGDAAAARTTLDQALFAFPNFPRAIELRQRIDADK